MVLSGGELRTSFNSKSRFWAIFSFWLNNMYRVFVKCIEFVKCIGFSVKPKHAIRFVEVHVHDV
jgi:hypothetical protein